jgi:hypothetical protein
VAGGVPETRIDEGGAPVGDENPDSSERRSGTETLAQFGFPDKAARSHGSVRLSR